MCPAFLAMVRSQAAERLKEWQVSSFGNDVLILRDPNETQEAGKNIKAFYMRNAESKFQRATREAFHEYRKMLKDKGEKVSEEKPLRKAPTNGATVGQVFEISDKNGKTDIDAAAFRPADIGKGFAAESAGI
ncbi:MAG: hypothetical protein ACI4PW_02695 [Alphaproteobacteria bacterium]|jgi:hypothetical protein